MTYDRTALLLIQERQEKAENIASFLRESLAIEGIHREPTEDEIAATSAFLDGPLTVATLLRLQEVYAPGKPVRDRIGMNVRVGFYHPPMGGREILISLEKFCKRCSRPRSDPWKEHIAFEKLHPFMDGNGRTGRAAWAWHMLKQGRDPFSLSFLHRFYYETLAHS